MLTSNYFTPTELKLFNSQEPIFNSEQMRFINRETPRSVIEIKKDVKGNEYKSVKSSYVKALVTLVTGGNYSFEIKDQIYLGATNEVKTTARLTIYANGKAYVREQNGKAKAAKNNADSYKASSSDSFKKCASEFGFCWDIYAQEKKEVEKEQEMSYEEKQAFDKMEINFTKCTTIEQLEELYDHVKNNTEEKSYHEIIFNTNKKRLLKK